MSRIQVRSDLYPPLKRRIRVRTDLYPHSNKIRVRSDLYPQYDTIRVRKDLYPPQYNKIRVRRDLYPESNIMKKEPKKENEVPLKKRIRVRSDLYPQSNIIKKEPTPSFREEKTLPFKKRRHVRNQFTYSNKQNVKKKAYVPRHDEKLLKMTPRVVLKKLNIVKIPLYKRYPKSPKKMK